MNYTINLQSLFMHYCLLEAFSRTKFDCNSNIIELFFTLASMVDCSIAQNLFIVIHGNSAYLLFDSQK